MELDQIVQALQDPAAFPHPAGDLKLHHTHISVVVLAGDFAYKVKKPVDLGFLDFTTLERRRHFCSEEVRLNRRLAPDVYLDVVSLTLRDGGLRVGGEGDPVEYAVRMRRLAPDATALARLERGELGPGDVEHLAVRIARFHDEAPGGERIEHFGRYEVVAGNARENFEQSRSHLGHTVEAGVFERARALTEAELERRRQLIEDRARRGVPRDTHGDLHLDHVYFLPGRSPPGDMAIVDCIEFNERFRFADPVSDMAFLAMDLAYRDRRDLAARFTDAYLEAAADPEGRALVPLYRSYRSAVRAKVEGIASLDAEVPEAARSRAAERACAYWLLTLGQLEIPPRRPGLVLVAGLPATGKSTLAAGLAEHASFEVLASDRVRKELAGVPPGRSAAAAPDEGLYAPEWTERTYAALLDRASAILHRGGRALVDASFHREERRREFVALARSLAVPVCVLVCRTDAGSVRRRLESRAGGPSDADWEVYRTLA
ncbi:MAG: AAA family ATPase, partial [Candidatus Palauibacterales bacterium]|nr:AAA family ATPase [Candidatus Palauibacterales bacterium]